MSISRRHLELAAKLWALALIAHTDCAPDDANAADPTAEKIRTLAGKRAKTKLRRLGTAPGAILNEADALEEAGRLIRHE